MRRKVITFISILISIIGFNISLYAQEKEDSIAIYISQLPDSAKLDVLYNTALSFEFTSLSKGLYYADWRLDITSRLPDKNHLARTYNLYGNLYHESGLYSNAEKYYIMSYDIYMETGNSDGLATECHNLGLTYFHIGDTINSLRYYNESIDFRKKGSTNIRIGDGLTTLGETLLQLGDYDKSIVALYEAIDYYGDTLAYPRKMDCIIFIIDNLILKSPTQVHKWFTELKINNEILQSDRYGQLIKFRYASYYLSIGLIDESVRSISGLNVDSIYFDALMDPVEIFLLLSEKLFERGSVKKGLDFSKMARELHNIRERSLITELTSEFKTRLNLRIADEELIVMNELNKLTLQHIRIEKFIKSIMLIAVILISIISLSLLISYIQLRYDHKRLKTSLSEMKDAHERLIKYKESILRTRANKNVFFTMISGKLNQPFRDLTSELDSLTSLTSKSIVKDRFVKKLLEILRNGTNIEKSLKRVLLWSKLQRNKYEVQNSEINLNDYLHELLPDILSLTIRKDIRVRFDVDHKLTIIFDKHSLKTIIRILLENSVDNSDQKTDIIIRGQSARSGSIISITDFGKGIPGWLQPTLFNINRQSGEPETQKLGISLLIAKNLAEINNSYISFESNQKKGTTFFIHITDNNE